MSRDRGKSTEIDARDRGPWEIDHNKGGTMTKKLPGSKEKKRGGPVWKQAKRVGRLEDGLGHLARGLANTEIGENCVREVWAWSATRRNSQAPWKKELTLFGSSELLVSKGSKKSVTCAGFFRVQLNIPGRRTSESVGPVSRRQ